MLKWSEVREPQPECRYHHCVADTPLGKIRLEWKGWKDSDWPGASMPWGENSYVSGFDLDDAKAAVQDAYDSAVREAMKLVSKVDE